jgi:glycosyltransferase involved in cell wall biosynthesis
MKPKISICVPTYNGSQFLRECLNSILAQTFSNFELLIVDDRSSDNTVEIAEEYAAKDSRIEVHRNPQNLGLVGNWTRCIELANGEWIKFVFQDDKIAPNCLEKLFAATKLGKPIVYCRREFIFEPGTNEDIKTWYLTHLSSRNPFGDKLDISGRQYAELTLKNIGINLIGEPTSVMLHRSVFFKFGCFNPHTITICDFEFYTRIAVNTGIVQVPEVLAQFRIHGTSETSFCSNNRNYRAKILDELILIHDFAFHVAYEPLRAVARQYLPEIDLIQLFDQKTVSAWKIARREQRSTNKESTFSPHVELEEVSKFHPLIANIVESNTLESWKYDVFLTIDFLVISLKCWLKRFPPIAWYLQVRSQSQ